MTLDEVLDEARRLPTVITVERAGRLLGMGRSAAYEAARRGDLPTIRWGRRLLCPTVRVLELLGLDPAHLTAPRCTPERRPPRGRLTADRTL